LLQTRRRSNIRLLATANFGVDEYACAGEVMSMTGRRHNIQNNDMSGSG